MEENSTNSKSAVHLLSHEIRRVQNDKRGLLFNRLQDEKTFRTLEHKYLLAKDMVIKLKEEKQELLQQNFKLKSKADQWASKLSQVRSQWKRFDEIGSLHVSRRRDQRRFSRGDEPIVEEEMEGNTTKIVQDGYEIVGTLWFLKFRQANIICCVDNQLLLC
jgi:predicted nuclease with TOPRIM domain